MSRWALINRRKPGFASIAESHRVAWRLLTLENKMYSLRQNKRRGNFARSSIPPRLTHILAAFPQPSPGITDQTLGLPTSGHGAKVDSQNMAVRDMGIHGTEPLRRPVRFNLHMSGAAAVVRYVEHRWRSGAGRLVFSCDASAPPRQPPRAKQVLMPQC
ncbi:hypothetical protein DSI35_22360 [Mycobacterium tuberculosis]|uniref:Uncharacterized protein n=2 Tax=Mycobacterium tuberculosis complex TaxID=77643 RepID=A0AB73Y9P4_MYCTX|nr:hypothetical protein BTU11_12785 [Mycobacterium tuberculosis]AYP12627.1 hypothetical protein EBQ37_13055 [Mycobacterium tuberculosis variant bovis BCG]ORT85146.1 hypothetical protein BS299_16045 [Mycobacterium tuberculosis M13]PRH90516.1 hypothetical protein B8A26_17215 [Mycobacterium tuberculosis variant pinnipedii]PRI02429.1 hypothetical protein B8A30_00860 [Mycobacterium tuberculosis variant africanum]PRI05080.1 hypothetical protein B8A25_06940 [Mycobacterium tuberculosis variant microti